MLKYIGTKIVQAIPMTRAAYNAYRNWELPKDENGDDEGYLVEYLDGGKPNHPQHAGYISWSPKEQFDNAYRPTTDMSFGMAIEALKTGYKVARAGWNGKSMYLWLMPSTTIPVEWCKEPHLKQLAEQNGGSFEALSTIRMKTADNKVLTGWLASQTDMLAEDWMVVQ